MFLRFDEERGSLFRNSYSLLGLEKVQADHTSSVKSGGEAIPKSLYLNLALIIAVELDIDTASISRTVSTLTRPSPFANLIYSYI